MWTPAIPSQTTQMPLPGLSKNYQKLLYPQLTVNHGGNMAFSTVRCQFFAQICSEKTRHVRIGSRISAGKLPTSIGWHRVMSNPNRWGAPLLGRWEASALLCWAGHGLPTTRVPWGFDGDRWGLTGPFSGIIWGPSIGSPNLLIPWGSTARAATWTGSMVGPRARRFGAAGRRTEDAPPPPPSRPARGRTFNPGSYDWYAAIVFFSPPLSSSHCTPEWWDNHG